MARKIAASIGDLRSSEDMFGGFEFEELPIKLIEVPDVTDGMNIALPRSEVTPGSFLLARNARVTSKGIRRRGGTEQYQTKPDSDPVLAIVGIVNTDEIAKLIRITPSTAHYSLDGAAFVEYDNTGATTEMDGTMRRPECAIYLDDLYIAGFSELLRIEEASGTIAPVSSGPGQAKFIANFADRIILGNFDGEPYKLKWSANADPTDWTDSSSGEENLVQGQEGLGDSITGLFSVEDELVILRRGSIWVGSRQPFADNPFRFAPLISKIGCDLPHSAVRVPGGVIFADRTTNGVYFYERGRFPEKLNNSLGEELFNDIALSEWVQASFDPENLTYVLGITQTGGSMLMEKFWYYRILEKAWTFDDGPAAQCLSFFAFREGLAIDSLPLTIDDLSGSIDDLATFSLATRQYRGLESGEILLFDDSIDTDFGDVAFEFELQSPNIGSISTRRTLTDFMAEVEVDRAGTVIYEQSNNGSVWRNTKTINFTTATTRIAAKKNPITGNDLFWRARASSGAILVKSWWARLQEKGMQR